MPISILTLVAVAVGWLAAMLCVLSLLYAKGEREATQPEQPNQSGGRSLGTVSTEQR